MFSIEADRILTTLWDTLRPDKPDYERDGLITVSSGIVVTLDLRLSHFATGGDDYRRSALVHTVFTGNTSVFQAVCRDFTKWHKIDPSDWFNYSNHDSCWRTDGMRGLTSLYFAMTEELNEEILADGYSPQRPIDFHQFCSLGTLAGKPWESVTVRHERVPGDSYRRRIVALERKD